MIDLSNFRQRMIQSKVHYLAVSPEHAGQRLDNYLLREYKQLPKSRLYRIIRKGEVRVNKKRVDPDYRLQAHDQIRMPPLKLELQPTKQLKIDPKLSKLLTDKILYEDKQLLIINKPAGMAVHGGSGLRFGVIEALRAMRPQEKHLELAHRLDRETSGCLLIAKKPSVLRECHMLLREGKMTKVYLLLVKGHWPKHLNEINESLYKNQVQSGERMVRVSEDGKQSQTLFRIKSRFKETTLLEAEPKTGRTHQIRVHALSAGHPVVGDDKYGDKDFNKLMRAYGCDRLFLHAQSLEFSLSTQSGTIKAFTPLDETLQQCLKRLAH
jgi:23S rRNA pseudouridine955/2504/2580 synthase